MALGSVAGCALIVVVMNECSLERPQSMPESDMKRIAAQQTLSSALWLRCPETLDCAGKDLTSDDPCVIS